MPVFVNEIILTGTVSAPPPIGGANTPAAAPTAADRDRLIAAVTEAVFRRLEHALARIGER